MWEKKPHAKKAKHKHSMQKRQREDTEEWSWLLTFFVHTSNRTEARYVSPLWERRGNGYVEVQGKPYILSAEFLSQHWNLLQIASDETCPFQIQCGFDLDEHEQPHVQSLDLWLHTQRFLEAMSHQGFFSQQVAITKVIRSSMAQCLGVSQPIAEVPKPVKYHLRSKQVQQHVPTHIPHWQQEYVLLPMQEQSLRWMLQLEQRIQRHEGFFSVNLASVPLLNTDWYYDRAYDVLTRDPTREMTVVPYHGGILTDPSGSGKTPVTLALIALTASEHVTYEALPLCLRDCFFVSRATLIITPYHLPRQWLREIHKFYQDGHMKIVELLSWHHFQRVTLTDILEADIILTTVNFLRNRRYVELVTEQVRNVLQDTGTQSYLMIQPHVMHAATRAALKRSPPGFPMEGHVPLQSVWFKRLVIDEVDDLFFPNGFHRRGRLLPRLYAGTTWGLTNHVNVGPTGFLPDLCKIIGIDPINWTPELNKAIVQTCFSERRLTPVTTTIQERVHWVDLTANERHLLNTHLEEPLLQKILLCTYFNIKAESKSDDTIRLRTIEDILAVVRTRRLKQIQSLRSTVQKQSEALDAVQERQEQEQMCYEESAAHQSSPGKLERQKEHLDMIQRKVDRMTQAREVLILRMQTMEKSLEYFEEHVKTEDVTCPICFTHEADVITYCGHFYCRPCIIRTLRHTKKCPLCNASLRSQDAHQIRDRHDPEDIVKRYGSKIAEVLRVLHDILQAKEAVVMVAQSIPLLTVLRTVLAEQDIPCGLVVGNTSCTNSILERFEREEFSVLLLCPTSGLNLTHANHVFFLHALVGTPQEVKHWEQDTVSCVQRQNQSRHISVHRFLTRNTAEEKLHFRSVEPLVRRHDP